MNEEGDNPVEDERLEGLLRRWGAEEASVRHAGGSPPLPQVAALRSPVLRWLPLAAGFLALVAGAGLFLASRTELRGPDVPEVGASQASDEMKQLRQELAQAVSELEESRTALAEARRRLDEQSEEFAEQIAQIRESFASENADLAAEAKRRSDALAASIKEKDGLLKAAENRLKEREAALASLKRDLDGSRREVGQVREKFAADAKRLQKAHEAVAAAQRELQ
ncbi:MAG: hypothetical protein QGD94_11575, partial [Planctomycetia bacterium]|nr:hypothetical protein [Planctomycetia bacterium]